MSLIAGKQTDRERVKFAWLTKLLKFARIHVERESRVQESLKGSAHNFELSYIHAKSAENTCSQKASLAIVFLRSIELFVLITSGILKVSN